jgi:general secretion pathway protein I
MTMPALRKQAGFTLLEILIALAILAIVMISMIKITSDNTRNLWHIENKTLAGIIAANHATQIQLTEEKPELSDGWETMAGRKWYWQATRAVTTRLGLWHYKINVYLEGDKEPYITLTRLVPAQIHKPLTPPPADADQ